MITEEAQKLPLLLSGALLSVINREFGAKADGKVPSVTSFERLISTVKHLSKRKYFTALQRAQGPRGVQHRLRNDMLLRCLAPYLYVREILKCICVSFANIERCG